MFDGSINIVLTFGFGYDITILKMAILAKVDCIDIEPALLSCVSPAIHIPFQGVELVHIVVSACTVH